MQATQSKNEYEFGTVLYMALELSNRTWKVACSNGEKCRQFSVGAGNRKALLEHISQSKTRFGLSNEIRVVSCHEAGRDGHWIVRWLRSEGIDAMEIDSSSIEVKRGRKHRKSDSLDAERLLDSLMRYCCGFRRSFSVVRVPSIEDEENQRVNREWDRLVKERTRYRNRMTSLLVTQGLGSIRISNGLFEELERIRLWDGSRLCAGFIAELRRIYALYQLVVQQLKELDAIYQAELSTDSVLGKKRGRLELLKGVGPRSSRVLVSEAFGWRHFRNAKQVGGFSGLVPTPSSSGALSH